MIITDLNFDNKSDKKFAQRKMVGDQGDIISSPAYSVMYINN